MGIISFKDMAEKWPSSVVARTEIERFTGGILKEKYLANLDCQGKGPEGRIRIGRKIAYPVNSVIAFLEQRATPVKEKREAAL
ncbi:MAG: hypothetical protein JW882_00775 [Deltaproteobacteria bacterium]|nr:hypothetical protein [Deltaproteobacteria bacterium]